jgi:hypothetical protein
MVTPRVWQGSTWALLGTLPSRSRSRRAQLGPHPPGGPACAIRLSKIEGVAHVARRRTDDKLTAASPFVKQISGHSTRGGGSRSTRSNDVT